MFSLYSHCHLTVSLYSHCHLTVSLYSHYHLTVSLYSHCHLTVIYNINSETMPHKIGILTLTMNYSLNMYVQ